MDMAAPPKPPVVCLVFNGVQTEAAVALYRSRAIHILDCGPPSSDPADWKGETAVLRQHDGCVSALAWHPTTGHLLSCGHDGAAYVWTRRQPPHTASASDADADADADGVGPSEWVPQMVIVGPAITCGLTSCAWSASGKKLYVGAASANVAVGRFEQEGRWWVCRALQAHRSTVTAVAPHPTLDALLASGGLDGCVALQSSLMKKVDGCPRGGAAAFGTVYHTRCLGAWVHALAWSRSGERLAIATHDSCVHVLSVDGAGSLQVEEGGSPLASPCFVCRFQYLPLLSLTFLGESDDRLVGAGESYMPILLTSAAEASGDWKLAAVGGARHTGSIRSVVAAAAGGGFVTAGMDGRIVRWQEGDWTPPRTRCP